MTFSIAARCSESGMFGMAISSSSPAVAARCTHARAGVGAMTLASDLAGFRRWISGSDRLKPGAHMPAYAMLPEADLQALAAYLEGLQ